MSIMKAVAHLNLRWTILRQMDKDSDKMAPWEVLLAGSVNLGLNENYYAIHYHKQLT